MNYRTKSMVFFNFLNDLTIHISIYDLNELIKSKIQHL